VFEEAVQRSHIGPPVRLQHRPRLRDQGLSQGVNADLKRIANREAWQKHHAGFRDADSESIRKNEKSSVGFNAALSSGGSTILPVVADGYSQGKARLAHQGGKQEASGWHGRWGWRRGIVMHDRRRWSVVVYHMMAHLGAASMVT
jgi:hypothetical protein